MYGGEGAGGRLQLGDRPGDEGDAADGDRRLDEFICQYVAELRQDVGGVPNKKKHDQHFINIYSEW